MKKSNIPSPTTARLTKIPTDLVTFIEFLPFFFSNYHGV